MEGHIERLVTECECTTEQFFDALKVEDPGEREQCVNFILAAAEYENFIEMMRSYKKKLQEQAQ